MEIPHDGPYADLVWSDPDHIDTWVMSNRYVIFIHFCLIFVNKLIFLEEQDGYLDQKLLRNSIILMDFSLLLGHIKFVMKVTNTGSLMIFW